MEHQPAEPPTRLADTGQAPLLRIYMLGGFRLLRGEQDLHPERWDLQRAAAVFKYLVSEEGRWVPSDVLLELFWPELEPERARAALYTTIYALRHALEPDREAYQPSSYIEAARGRYRFRTEAPHWWDVRAFLDTLAAARKSLAAGNTAEGARQLDEALSLYRGDFLTEDRYEEWTVLLRERLRQVYLEAAMQLGQLASQRPEWAPAAIGRLREAVTVASEREDLHRQLIALLAATGRTADALRQYEALRKLLQEEFGADPAPETEALVSRIRRGELPRREKGASLTVPEATRAEPAPTFPGEALRDPRPGALVVDWPTFRRMVQLERRRMQRWKVPVAVLLVSRGAPPSEPGTSWEEVERWVDRELGPQANGPGLREPIGWQEVTARRLRQGDVACPVGPHWLLVLLAHADEPVAQRVASRLAEAASAWLPDPDEPQPAVARQVEVRLVSLLPAA